MDEWDWNEEDQRDSELAQVQLEEREQWENEALRRHAKLQEDFAAECEIFKDEYEHFMNFLRQAPHYEQE